MRVAERRDRAAHAALSSTEWMALAADASTQVRKAIAGRLDAPADVLIALASDNTKTVREVLVENPRCPGEALAYLAEDSDPYICRQAIQHPNATMETRNTVAVSGDGRARRALAQMDDLDAETARQLAEDDDWHVREELAWATQHADVVSRLLRDPHPRVRGSVALNPIATHDQRRALAQDRSAQTRGILAGADGNPDDVLFTLASDKSENVRFWLTVHGTNRPLMELLMKDSSGTVADTARSSLRRPPRSDVVWPD